MKKICQTCRWWDREAVASIHGKLDCLKVGRGEIFTIYNNVGMELHTASDFGCICWEKENREGIGFPSKNIT